MILLDLQSPLTLKLLLVYSNKELYQKYTGYISQIKRIKKRQYHKL